MFDFDYRQGSKPDQINVCCPYCIDRVGVEDTKYHMGINLKYQTYNCFRCGASPKETGKLSLKNFELLFGDKRQTGFSELIDRAKALYKPPRYHELDLNMFSVSIDEQKTPFSYAYLLERGMSEQDIKTLNLRAGKPYKQDNGKYNASWKGRVIFPYYDFEGLPIYAVGRTFLESNIKYKNTDGSKKGVLYWLEPNIDTCVVCEGIFSAIAIKKYTGLKAIPLLGKFLHRWQLDQLRSNCKSIILSLDGDVVLKDLGKIVKMFLQVFPSIELVRLPNEEGKADPDELGKDYINYFDKREKINMFNFKSYFVTSEWKSWREVNEIE